MLNTRFSLGESRLLWELAHRPATTAAELGRTLALDSGYLSRLLAALRERGLVKAQRASHDARQTLLTLSAAGRRAYAPLDQRANQEMARMLQALGATEQRELMNAAACIQGLLGEREAAAVQLRAHHAGDMGWVVSRHGVLYAQEYGWDQRFEALVARIAADFIDHFDPAREACWIAERHDQPLGSVVLVQARDDVSGAPEPGVAQLRLLLVEPHARGLGLGKRLSAECESFARAAGYTHIRLWTNSLLLAARGIYAAAGYQLLASEAHQSFGQNLVGEIWEKELPR